MKQDFHESYQQKKKKDWKECIAKALFMVTAITILPATESYAGWVQSSNPPVELEIHSGWWYATNQDNTSWYAATGEVPVAWYWIDGNQDGIAECYAFEKNGWMYSDTVTPDGYAVNENGAWIVDGVVQTKQSSLVVGHGTGGGTTSVRKGSSGGGGASGGNSGGHSSSSSSGGGSHSSGSDSKPPSDFSDHTEAPVASASDATSSDMTPERDTIHWTIYFVSEDDHNQKLWPTQSGEIQDGGIISVNYPEIIYGEDGSVWTSKEAPPIERIIYGPGNYMEYLEFSHTGDIAPSPEENETEKNQLKEYLTLAKQEERNITGENPEDIPDERFIVTDQSSNDFRIRSIATQIKDTDSHTFYVVGKNFVPNGKTVAQWFGDDAVYSNLLENTISVGKDLYYVARMSVEWNFTQEDCDHIWTVETEHPAGCLEKGTAIYECGRCGAEREVVLIPDGHQDEDGDGICDRCHKEADGTLERIHWEIGDLQARELDGNTYLFRCIDQNYSDSRANHQQSALFLSESVIPADYGSDYKVKQFADGSHKYVFQAGPIVNFGKSNDYKYSAIRKWLDQSADQIFQPNKTSIGVDYAYMGKTAVQEFSQFDSNDLKSYYIGSQKMTQSLFILSVDEAVKYRDYLWKFDGSEEDNPESQYSAFSKGYWLRSPMGNSANYDTDSVYVVDLVNGNIHPAAIQPEVVGNDELDVTTTYGVRPAFTMPQD